MIRATVLLIFVFSVMGCAYGAVRLSNLNYPLAHLQKVSASTVPIGLRKTSSNRREFLSEFFVYHEGRFQDPGSLKKNFPVRYYAHIFVLGDRRPYNVDVIVYKQEKSGASYQNAGTDRKYAKMIVDRIKMNLDQGPSRLNVIDDFRAF